MEHTQLEPSDPQTVPKYPKSHQWLEVKGEERSDIPDDISVQWTDSSATDFLVLIRKMPVEVRCCIWKYLVIWNGTPPPIIEALRADTILYNEILMAFDMADNVFELKKKTAAETSAFGALCELARRQIRRVAVRIE